MRLHTQPNDIHLPSAPSHPDPDAGPAPDELAGYDLRDTLADIVVRPATFVSFRAALDARRSRLH